MRIIKALIKRTTTQVVDHTGHFCTRIVDNRQPFTQVSCIVDNWQPFTQVGRILLFALQVAIAWRVEELMLL